MLMARGRCSSAYSSGGRTSRARRPRREPGAARDRGSNLPSATLAPLGRGVAGGSHEVLEEHPARLDGLVERDDVAGEVTVVGEVALSHLGSGKHVDVGTGAA